MIYNSHHTKVDAFDSFRDLDLHVRDAVATLKPVRNRFDCLVVRGVSGLIVGAPVSLRIRRPVVVVRKPDELSHRGGKFANIKDLGERCLFLDDMIATGETYEYVCGVVEAEYKNGMRCTIVGEYTYDNNHLSWRWKRR